MAGFQRPITARCRAAAQTAAMISAHPQTPHRSHRAGWLRAAVLGANDGIVSVAGLLVGVAASGGGTSTLLATGMAGTVAGAMSMAAGEYVSVQSQRDAEHADLALEQRQLHGNPVDELDELAAIYRQRGLDPALAAQVAAQLTAHDALASHARDELGITPQQRARPLQAAAASAAAFIAGAALPLLATVLLPAGRIAAWTSVITLAGLAVTGAWAARMGGAAMVPAAVRGVFWGALAMLAAHLIGRFFQISGA